VRSGTNPSPRSGRKNPGFRIVGAEQEDGRRRGDGVEELGIALRQELKRLHRGI